MKKILSLMLACIMLLSLCACGSTAPAGDGAAPAPNAGSTTAPAGSEGAFQVGFGSGDITPDWPIGLQGYGNEATRISTGFSTYIYIHCVAITDTKGETALIMSIDAGGGGFEKNVRPAIEQEFGIPQDHIIFSALHQHSTPYGGEKYVELLISAGKKAVKQALEDRAPATMLINTVETEALSFVRHYIANDPDGSIVTDNYNDAIGAAYGYKCHESEGDKEMRLVKFDRGANKKPIIMVNFQAHPHMGAGSSNTNIHADWPGIMRETVASELNAHCIYFSGAGGNMNSTSRIAEENVSKDWKHHGQRAAEYVINAEGSYKEVNTGDIKVKVVTNAYATDHSMDYLLQEATYIHNLRSQDFNLAVSEVKNYPNLHSIYHASSIVTKAGRGDTYDLTIGAIAIGDVVFTFHPYEMFDTNGMELRAGTVGNANYESDEQLENPYAMTFICTLGNGHLGYVPSQLGYTNGGYSTDIAYLAPGSGERLVGDYLAILNELHGE